MPAHIRLSAITVFPADDTPPFLLVRIQIACDACDPNVQQEFVIHGHHLKPILELLQGVVDDVEPALTEDGGENTITHRWVHPSLTRRVH